MSLRVETPAPLTASPAAPKALPPVPRGRVVHVIHSGGFYGAEKVVCDLAREQAAGAAEGPGPAPVLLALLDPGVATNEVAERASAEGTEVVRLNVDRGISRASLRAYAAALAAAGAGLAHSHGYKATQLHLLSRALGMHRVPLLVTAHGYPKGSGSFKATLYRWLDLLSLAFAGEVVAVSGEMQDYLGARNPLLKPVLIPNGIPASLAARGTHPLKARLASEGADPDDGTPVIGSAGRLVPMKNHELLIRAYARLKAREAGVPCRLVILGEGPLRPRLEALWRELLPGEPVRIYPFQPDVLEWMADMDVFCLPSRDGEGLPIALLEAGLLERTLVCSDSGGIPEVIRDRENGRVFPMEDLEALTRALADCLRDPGARAAYGRALRAGILREHDIRVTHGRYLEAYARVLARPR